jgi:predicted RNA-binding protein YlqC (UPF0109 family)
LTISFEKSKIKLIFDALPIERKSGAKGRKEILKIMAKLPADQEFLEYIVKSLVDHKDDVKIARKVDEMGVLLSLKVHPDDMGQIIGKGGATARAIRSLVRLVGAKNHARVNLKIEEPEKKEKES